MVRRVVADTAAVDSVSESYAARRMPVASVIANVVTAVYGVVIALIGLDTLLTAMGANERSGFVSAVDTMSAPLLAPFTGMFGDQRYWATAVIAALVYTIAYLVVTAALRRDAVVVRR